MAKYFDDGFNVYNLDNAIWFKVGSVSAVSEVYALQAVYGEDLLATMAQSRYKEDLLDKLKALKYILYDVEYEGLVAIRNGNTVSFITDKDFKDLKKTVV